MFVKLYPKIIQNWNDHELKSVLKQTLKLSYLTLGYESKLLLKRCRRSSNLLANFTFIIVYKVVLKPNTKKKKKLSIYTKIQSSGIGVKWLLLTSLKILFSKGLYSFHHLVR